MKKRLAEALRDVRVVAMSVVLSTLLLGGGLVSANLSAFSPSAKAVAPGQVIRGEYALGGATDGNSVANDDIKLPRKLRYPIAGSRYELIKVGGPYTLNCPGLGQVVPRGYLCVYERHHEGANTYLSVWDPTLATPLKGIGRTRMIIHGYGQTASIGSWALRAGDATTARTSGSRTTSVP